MSGMRAQHLLAATPTPQTTPSTPHPPVFTVLRAPASAILFVTEARRHKLLTFFVPRIRTLRQMQAPLGACIIIIVCAARCLVGDSHSPVARLGGGSRVHRASPRPPLFAALRTLRGGGPATIEPGDWACGKCAKSNFKRRERYIEL